MNDLKLIGKSFEDYELPVEKKYLLHYFKTDIENMFLKYYCCFENVNVEYFINHTGFFCKSGWLNILKKRFETIEKFHKKAKLDFDFDLLEKIELGKCIRSDFGLKQ